jgi:hypothetical protein
MDDMETKLIEASIGTIGTLTTALIGICALGLTIYQAVLARKHNRLSVRPHLTRFTNLTSQPGRGVLSVDLINKGIGPAFISAFEVYLDGNPITDVGAAVKEIMPTRHYHQQITTLTTDYALSAGESKSLLTLAVALDDGETVDQLEQQLSRLDLRVNYESAYEETYQLDTREGKLPKPGKAT